MSENTVVTSVRHWTPPDRIKVHKDPRFAYRWIRKQDVDTRLDEGYVLASKTDQAEAEVTSIDKAAHYRGMILMKMPKHMAKERSDFYIEKHNRRVRASAVGAGMQDEAARANGKAGGDLVGGIIGKTVIERGVASDNGVLSRTTETFDPKDVDPASVQEVVDLKKEIAQDVKEKESKGSRWKNRK